MKAILLAAGFGTRLRPLTDTIPKCLVPIQGRPLLDIWLADLTEAGVGPFLVNTHYLAGAVEQFVARSPYRAQVTLAHEPRLLGTAGTLLANRGFYGREPVMLVHADNLCVCDFRAFVRAHEQRPAGTALTMMTFVTDAPETCGIVTLDDRGVVTEFHEKVTNPPGNLANGAVYILEPEVVDFADAIHASDFSTQVLPPYVGRIFAWHNAGLHYDIGSPAALEAANQAVACRRP